MKCLVVVAHPLKASLCQVLAQTAIDTLRQAGHEVVIEGLYESEFPPALTDGERASYYTGGYADDAVKARAARLQQAEALVLVFPTWWFGFPAILKGWFDRVWAPGIAYDHASDLGPIRPRLLGLKKAVAVTTLGSPWWVDRLILRRPVKRVLKSALLGTCAPNCAFQMLSLYRVEQVSEERARRFGDRVVKILQQWK